MTEYLTPEQAADRLPQFKADWFRAQLRTGRLVGSKVGGRWVTTQEALDALVESGSNSTRRRRRRAA
jgi:hypothetical protein